MERSATDSVLGVVVVHQPEAPVAALPAVTALVGQVADLVLVWNGAAPNDDGRLDDPRIRSITFPTNRGTAAAWNAALASAVEHGHRFLYLLDQDSTPAPDAVAVALAQLNDRTAAAVVQPTRPGRLGLDPFPWNTVASGSLFQVDALRRVGGFDERLFVDEVDHEVFARLAAAGHRIEELPRLTIDHAAGTPRPLAYAGLRAVTSGHSPERRRLQGFSAGVLVRRNLRSAPLTAARLLARHGLNAAKDLAAGQRRSVARLVAGLGDGLATRRPPLLAAARSCPYCGGVLVGRFASVPDWRFRTGPAGDVYRCVTCRALAAGWVPDQAVIASWYANYYTHSVEPTTTRPWSRLWPTRRRQREMAELRRYFAPVGSTGRFLEVGCGSGERLVAFADEGWDVVGQDPDPQAGHLARKRGLVVHRCPVAELVGVERPFDLIGLSHVLEHAPDPEQMLKACAALLAPGGNLCIISPNAQSFGRRCFGPWWFGLEQPRHLAIPSLDSLRRVTTELGLQATFSKTVATNGAVILGGSLDRPMQRHLPGPLRRVSRALCALLGQAMSRVAIGLHPSLGEEVVWLGHDPPPS